MAVCNPWNWPPSPESSFDNHRLVLEADAGDYGKAQQLDLTDENLAASEVRTRLAAIMADVFKGPQPMLWFIDPFLETLDLEPVKSELGLDSAERLMPVDIGEPFINDRLCTKAPHSGPDGALARIAVAQAVTLDEKGTIATLAMIRDDWYRVPAIAEVVASRVRTGQVRCMAQAIGEISAMLVGIGLREGDAVVDRPHEPTQLRLCLAVAVPDLARSFAKHGLVQSALEAISESDNALESLGLLYDIAGVLERLGNSEGARRALVECQSYIGKLPACFSADAIWFQKAKYFARNGHFRLAIEATMKIGHEGLHAYPIREIANMQASIADFPGAIQTAFSITDKYCRLLTLWDIARFARCRGDAVLAVALEDMSIDHSINILGDLHAAYDNLYWSLRYTQYYHLAVLFAEAGDFDHALQAIEKIQPGTDWPDRAMCRVAELQCAHGLYEAARTSYTKALRRALLLGEYSPDWVTWVARSLSSSGMADQVVDEVIAMSSLEGLVAMMEGVACIQHTDAFSRLIIPCAHYRDGAYGIIGLLAQMHPGECGQLAELVDSWRDRPNAFNGPAS
jgi:tetratricopeptide (TPR) repeat protein